MTHAMERRLAPLLVAILVGCGTPETRFLSCMPRQPASEIGSYKWHDPFPDEDAGPKTFNRPRAFIQPRNENQKWFDKRYLNAAYGMPNQQYAWDASPTANVSQYQLQPLWRGQSTDAPISMSPIGTDLPR